MDFYLIPHELTEWIPIPVILVIGIVLDIIGARQARFGLSGWSTTDHVSHLGGFASGIVAALSVKHRARQRKEAIEMEEKSMNPVHSVESGQM